VQNHSQILHIFHTLCLLITLVQLQSIVSTEFCRFPLKTKAEIVKIVHRFSKLICHGVLNLAVVLFVVL